jgi:hypothetical protein
MFHRIVYDDKVESLQSITQKDLSIYGGKYVKVVVVNKTKQYMFDVFINNLYKVKRLILQLQKTLLKLKRLKKTL